MPFKFNPFTGKLDKVTAAANMSSTDLARVGSSTYSTVQHFANLDASTGRTSGGAISASGTANAVDVAAGTGWIKATDSDVAQILFFDWAASTALSVPSNTTRYIGVEYNSGSPQVVARTTDTWDYDTDFPLGICVNEGGTRYIINNPWATGDSTTNIVERFDSMAFIARDNRVGGLIVSNSGTRNIAVTAGTILARLSEFPMLAIDTSSSGSFDRYYRDGAGGWTKQATQTQWPNDKYDDNSGTLQTAPVLTFVSVWWYLMADNSLAMLYGQNNVTSLSLSLNESPPAAVPDRIGLEGILLGRFIIQSGGSTPTTVQTAFGTAFTAAQVTDHGDLSGLTDDDHTQYARLAGRSGGQVLIGGTAAGDDLTLQTTAGVGIGGDTFIFKRGNNGASTIATLSSTGFDLLASTAVSFGAVAILSDSAGTTTLSNIDALDATTETTIEAAIDTLANLTSIQGQSISFSAPLTIPADPNADRILFWDDSAGATAWLAPGNSVAVTTTTFDTIQDIRTSATPQFTRLGLGAAADGTAELLLSGTAPMMKMTDTTASAKSLTIAVDANLANIRESAGASGSLVALDLANNLVGVQTASPTAVLDLVGGGTARSSFRTRGHASPTSPNEGDLWMDSTQKVLTTYSTSGMKNYVTGAINSTYGVGLAQNTTAETSILSATQIGTRTLAANSLVAGKTIRFKASGYGGLVSGDKAQWRIKYGALTIAGTANAAFAVQTSRAIVIQGEITCYSVGTTGTIWIQAQFLRQDDSGTIFNVYPLDNTGFLPGTAAVTIDTTASKLLDITVQYSAASNSNYTAITNFWMESLT